MSALISLLFVFSFLYIEYQSSICLPLNALIFFFCFLHVCPDREAGGMILRNVIITWGVVAWKHVLTKWERDPFCAPIQQTVQVTRGVLVSRCHEQTRTHAAPFIY